MLRIKTGKPAGRQAAAAAVTLMMFVAAGGVQSAAVPARQQAAVGAAGGDLEVVQLRPNFYVLAGAGGNIGVQTGQDGVVVVDAGTADRAELVVAAIRKLSDAPIRYVINTSADADHVGGNAVVARAGRTLLVTTSPLGEGMTHGGAAAILSHEGVLMRMSAPTGEVSPFPTPAWPTETFAERRRAMFLNDEGIEVIHQPAAHSDGDSIVFFRRSDVVVSGDVLDLTRFPVIDVARGGSIQGELAALNRLVELAIPSVPLVSRATGGTYVVPGHGRIADQLDVVEYRDMVTIVRDRIRDLIAQGKTLEEVQATSPARGYTRQYGSESGPWTTRMFVEAIYRSLTQEPKP
jgi:glyoxylase-like metal-dependent hydrolase (beta-lactamase superfamily II)